MENVHSAFRQAVGMELFHKRYFALNKSLSKNVLVALKRNGDDFVPNIFLYGAQDSVLLSLTQFATIIAEEKNLLDYLDCHVDHLEFDVSTADYHLTVCGKNVSNRFIALHQIDKITGRNNVVTMARSTLVRLIDMSSMLQRILVRLEKAVPLCKEMHMKAKRRELCPSFYDRITEHGFDLCVFANELLLFEKGVVDDYFN